MDKKSKRQYINLTVNGWDICINLLNENLTIKTLQNVVDILNKKENYDFNNENTNLSLSDFIINFDGDVIYANNSTENDIIKLGWIEKIEEKFFLTNNH